MSILIGSYSCFQWKNYIEKLFPRKTKTFYPPFVRANSFIIFSQHWSLRPRLYQNFHGFLTDCLWCRSFNFFLVRFSFMRSTNKFWCKRFSCAFLINMTLQTWEIWSKKTPVWEIKVVLTILLGCAIFINFPAKINFPVIN